MSKKRKIVSFTVWLSLIFITLAGVLVTDGSGSHETIREIMRDAVLHDSNKISLFGLLDVNPALISAFTVTGILLAAALLIRLFVIPKFR